MLDDYERVGVVARGGRSTVWKGFDPALKRDVALKELTADDAAEAARREAAALAGLRHPNIVSIYDVLDDDEVWLVEQWVTGAALSAVLAHTGKLRALDALALMHGALSGLADAHGRSVVHGDVAPSNVLIDATGTPMLVDFGLAVAPGQRSLGGTPGYLAPEAAAGLAVDPRSDVYSSCVLLAELLLGTRLFPRNSLAAAHRQASGAFDLGGIEAPVAAVLSNGLDPVPEKRPRDGGVLLAALEEAIEKTHGRGWLATAGLGAIGSTAATIAAGETLTSTASAGTTATTATTSKTTTLTKSRGKLIGAAATVGVVIVVVAFVLLRQTPPPSLTATMTPPGATPTAQVSQQGISGLYTVQRTPMVCGPISEPATPDSHHQRIVQQGDTLNIEGAAGPLNPDGSFVLTFKQSAGVTVTFRGTVSTEGGRTVIHAERRLDVPNEVCATTSTYVATKE